MTVNYLPSELLHSIFDYFCRNCYSLLLLRTICKQWKEIAEHSLLWLVIPLVIRRPLVFFQSLSRPYLVKYSNKVVIGIHDRIPMIPKDTFDIVVCQQQIYPWNTSDTANMILNNIENPMIPAPTNRLNKYEEAARICNKFIEKRNQINNMWDTYIRWAPYWKFWVDFTNGLFETIIFILLCVFSYCILAISVYSFSTMDNYPHSLTPLEIIGFVCIYWNGFFLSVSILLYVIGKICDHYYSDSERIDVYLISFSEVSVLLLMMLNNLIAITLSFGLLQSALSNNPSNNSRSSMKYIYISIPLWVFQIPKLWIIFTYVDMKAFQHAMIAEVIAWSIIFLTITLAGLYYDSPNDHYGIPSLGYVFLPIGLYGLGFFIVSVIEIFDSCKLIYRFVKGEPIVSESSNLLVLFRFFVNFLKTFSCLLMFGLIFNLLYQGFMNSLLLSTGLMTIVLFFLLIPFGLCFYILDKQLAFE